MLCCQLSISIDKPFRKLVDEAWLGRIVEYTLGRKGVDAAVELGLVVTNSRRIQRLNKRYRGRDEATDVLSFALLEGDASPFIPPPDGVLHLGEVILCYPQAVAQAEEHRHPLERELALLAVHGVLHLLGHGDEDAEAEAEMRAEEERILEGLEEDALL